MIEPVSGRCKTDVYDQFLAARRVSTPLISVTTPDYAATVARLSAPTEREKSTGEHYPKVQWDVIDGMTALNDPGKEAVRLACQEADIKVEDTISVVETLMAAQYLPPLTMLFLLGAHREMAEDAKSVKETVCAAWKLRDSFKANQRTLVLLSPAITLPADLANDVLALDEPLPGESELTDIARRVMKDAEVPIPAEPDLKKDVDAMRGLSAFAAEQAVAMSVRNGPDGARVLDREALWLRNDAKINDTPGLSVNHGAVSFDDIQGLDAIKTFTKRLFAGRKPPTAVFFWDEVEKAMAGTAGDLSGTSQDALQQMLTAMQENGWTGYIAMGYPGTGKSMIAQATASVGGVRCYNVDVGGTKGSLVGESEQNMRRMVKTIEAVAGDGALFIATCNRLTDDFGRQLLPPELLRRFTFDRFFFDLPDAAEREQVWQLYVKKYGLNALDLSNNDFSDEGWTPAQIKTCCDLAYRLDCSLMEASAYIVPFAQANARWVETLRDQADGNFLSASRRGPYVKPPCGKGKHDALTSTEGKRAFTDV